MKTVREFMNAHRRKTGERRMEAWLAMRGLCELQGDQSIANQAGAAFRADLNTELQALVTLSSGTSAPGTTYSHQLWADTSANNVLKKRNAANSAWLVVRTLDETFVLSRGSNTILGLSDIGKTIVATSAFTQTLTAAATLADGWWIAYSAQGNSIVIDPNGAETIDGAATKTVTGSGFIFCNGSNFFTVGFVQALTGSFTATLTGCTAGVTGSAYYSITNNTVTLDIPVLTGTSNATGCTITGLPAAIQPATSKAAGALTQNASGSGIVSIVTLTGGTITLFNGTTPTNAFTNSGTKGLASGLSMSYTLN